MKRAIVLFSVAWILLGAFILFKSDGCDPVDTSKIFQCMTANELGDFLAGFFAPLAFLWLAYAVVIQSQELAAQRQELQLTRNELELTREVATEAKDATRAQAEESRRSANYFAKQTEMMEDEYNTRIQYRSLEIWEIRYNRYREIVSDLEVIYRSSDKETFSIRFYDRFYAKNDIREFIEHESDSIRVKERGSSQLRKCQLLAKQCLECWADISPVEKERRSQDLNDVSTFAKQAEDFFAALAQKEYTISSN